MRTHALRVIYTTKSLAVYHMKKLKVEPLSHLTVHRTWVMTAVPSCN